LFPEPRDETATAEVAHEICAARPDLAYGLIS